MMDLRGYTLEELAAQLSQWGEPSFRAKQLFAWLQQGAEPDEMTNLPKSLRQRLSEALPPRIQLVSHLRSSIDDTQKLLFGLSDGHVVEGVLMRYEHGVTLCLSTQVGCAMGCQFCASTLGGKERDLSAAEMLEQVFCANALLAPESLRVHNIVMMGCGEPLDNYDHTVRFLHLLRHPQGLSIGLRNVSLSTCGLVPQIERFALEGLPVTLSVSLHGADDATRRRTMPIANTYTVERLMEACRLYIRETGRRVIFEYALMDGINSSEADARKLARLLRGMQCHVNLIALNPVEERSLRGAPPEQVRCFQQTLEEQHISVTKRREMGRDINGACGQLRRSHLSKTGGKA